MSSQQICACSGLDSAEIYRCWIAVTSMGCTLSWAVWGLGSICWRSIILRAWCRASQLLPGYNNITVVLKSHQSSRMGSRNRKKEKEKKKKRGDKAQDKGKRGAFTQDHAWRSLSSLPPHIYIPFLETHCSTNSIAQRLFPRSTSAWILFHFYCIMKKIISEVYV